MAKNVVITSISADSAADNGKVPVFNSTTKVFDMTTPGGASGIGWSLKEYSTAAAAASITSGTLNLSTDLKYMIVWTGEWVSGSSGYAIRVNGVSTANSYWLSRNARGLDSGGAAATDNTSGKSDGWDIVSNSHNSCSGSAFLTLQISDSDNGARPTVRWEATVSGDAATGNSFLMSDGGGIQDTQTNVTSVTVLAGSGTKNWKLWIYKCTTS